jgi:hypothetical protein
VASITCGFSLSKIFYPQSQKHDIGQIEERFKSYSYNSIESQKSFAIGIIGGNYLVEKASCQIQNHLFQSNSKMLTCAAKQTIEYGTGRANYAKNG